LGQSVGVPDPEESYLALRGQAIAVADTGLVGPSAEHPRAIGVVVDVPARGGFATVVALADGTTSMYTSVGGGTIGAGSHAAVVEATHSLLSVVEAHIDAFARADDSSLPPPGSVRFHVVTPDGLLVTDVPEDSFWGRSPHPLMPIIASTQRLIGEISKV
jgi:hypothetical protein